MTDSKKPTRREFLVAGSAAALAATTSATGQAPTVAEDDSAAQPFASESLLERGPQRTYSGDKATQVAMPIGGIGAGSVCMNGYGGLQDFSIRTRPETTALPEQFSADSPEAAFAILHIKGSGGITKLVEGTISSVQDF